ncbi:putative pleckstrin-like proteiny-like domain, family B, member 2 [Operophtera brumata]|uniref:Putative pleckstrin-like proteiny-like domain, family B, member 2 n=1 Tax=Operophtera brumata TaxID=104452 RepID=A0A0L7LTS1_OPEBR|nr:putative pleckstrin-like proteiny-like domain, family B, member 2 [Operophtera brumata]
MEAGVTVTYGSVATNTPHLVSLGTGRLSTAVTLHPIKQGRVTVGSDPTCDIYVVGSGVASVHCRVENSHGVVTLYPVAGSTLVDSTPVDKPTRLSQGSMLTIGRTNYLRFNHPAEAMLMKSVLPSARRDQITADLTQLDKELDISIKEMSRTKPPVAPKDDKLTSIMSKVSKFEYYAKQHKNVGRSQFYTNTESEISPKVFSSKSLTVNTPAKDVLGGKTMPNYMKTKDQKVVINENNSVDPKSCTYANVAIRNNTKIGDIVKNFDEKLPKKVNNDVMNDSLYGKINNDRRDEKSNIERTEAVDYRNETKYQEYSRTDQDRQNECARSYKDTSFEISRSNQETRNQGYARTKQEFLRNNQITQDQDFPRTNQDLDHSRNQVRSDQESSRSQDRYPESSRSQARNQQFPGQEKHQEMSRSQDRRQESSTSQNRYAESSRSNLEMSRSQERSLQNGAVGVPQYSPVYANQKILEYLRKNFAYQIDLKLRK